MNLDAVSAALRAAVEAGNVPGVVASIHRRGELLLDEAYGWQDVEARVPMRRDTLFRIASMTKPIVAVAALMLEEEGRLDLGDRIDRWLPELGQLRVLRRPDGPLEDSRTASQPITVLHLLTHTSGLGYDFTSQGPLAEALRDVFDTDRIAFHGPRDVWLAQLGRLPLPFEPGLQFHYGLSTDVLGALIERIADCSLDEFLHRRLFEPLGMLDTGFSVAADRLDRLGPCYGLDPATDQCRLEDAAGAASRWAVPPVACSGGGGLVSTAADYLRFARMLLEGGSLEGVRIISPHSVSRMTINYLTAEQRRIPFLGQTFWDWQGMGFNLAVSDSDTGVSPMQNGASRGSFLWPGMTGTWWLADPREELVMIMLIQLRNAWLKSPQRKLQALTYRALRG